MSASVATSSGVRPTRSERAKVGTKSSDLINENARLKMELEQAHARERVALQTITRLEQVDAGSSAKPFSPEVEARRADYKRLAESIICQVEMEMNRAEGLLDIENKLDSNGNSHILLGALEQHFELLFRELDWMDSETIRRFYADMRLQVDQFTWDRAHTDSLTVQL